jgi:hypothetical protein
MADTFTLGTKEYYVVDLTDNLNLITAVTSPQYDIKGSNGSFVVTDQSAVVNPANALELWCMIDTTLNGASTPGGPTTSHDGSVHTWWTGGAYTLYVHFGAGSETPMFGPFTFNVDAS